MRRRVLWWGGLVAIGLPATGCFDSTPETPENALMDFLTAAQVGDDRAAGVVCDRLDSADADSEELAQLDRVVHEASVFGRGEVTTDGASAAVMIDVTFAPSPPGADGELWKAELVRESGRWKVCGFERADD